MNDIEIIIPLFVFQDYVKALDNDFIPKSAASFYAYCTAHGINETRDWLLKNVENVKLFDQGLEWGFTPMKEVCQN